MQLHSPPGAAVPLWAINRPTPIFCLTYFGQKNAALWEITTVEGMYQWAFFFPPREKFKRSSFVPLVSLQQYQNISHDEVKIFGFDSFNLDFNICFVEYAKTFLALG